MNISIGPVFSYARRATSGLVKRIGKLLGISHIQKFKNTISDVLSSAAVALLGEVIMRKGVLPIHLGDRIGHRKLLIELAIRSLVYSNILSKVLERPPAVGLCMTLGMIAVSCLAFRVIALPKYSYEHIEGLAAIGREGRSIRWTFRSFHSIRPSFFNDAINKHYMYPILRGIGVDTPLLQEIIFAEIPRNETILDVSNKRVFISVHNFLTDKVTMGEFTDGLGRLFHEIIADFAHFHQRGDTYTTDSHSSVCSLLLPVAALCIAVIGGFFNRLFNRLLGFSEEKKGLMTRIVDLVKKLIVYLLVAVMVIPVLISILHRLNPYQALRNQFIGEATKKILGDRSMNEFLKPIEQHMTTTLAGSG